MKFFKNIFGSKSKLEKLIDKYQSSKSENEKFETQTHIIEEIKNGKSDIFLTKQTDDLFLTFFINLKPMDGFERLVGFIFTNESELKKFSKSKVKFIKISCDEIYKKCLHFGVDNLFINYNSKNRYLLHLELPKQKSEDTLIDEIATEESFQVNQDEKTEFHPEYYISKLEEIGWFKQQFINEEVVKEKINKSSQQMDLILALSQIEYDAEGFEDIESYNNLFQEILTFIPNSNISIVGEQNVYTITLRMNEMTFNYDLHINSDWFDFGVFNKFINPALSQVGIENKFIELPYIDQIFRYIFTTTKLYNQVLEEKIITDKEHFI